MDGKCWQWKLGCTILLFRVVDIFWIHWLDHWDLTFECRVGKVDFDDDVEEDSKMGKLQAEHFELSRGTAGGERGEWAAANGARAQGHCLHTKEGSNSKCFDLRLETVASAPSPVNSMAWFLLAGAILSWGWFRSWGCIRCWRSGGGQHTSQKGEGTTSHCIRAKGTESRCCWVAQEDLGSCRFFWQTIFFGPWTVLVISCHDMNCISHSFSSDLLGHCLSLCG